jgi:hypothetical protein
MCLIRFLFVDALAFRRSFKRGKSGVRILHVVKDGENSLHLAFSHEKFVAF